MNYNASISDFFKAPRWKNNLLLGAVAMLIPMIGPIVLSGWHTTCFWARGHRDDPSGFPPFDFQFFGKYLERGVWPFLAAMVGSFVMMPVMMIFFFPMILIMASMDRGGHGHHEGMTIVLVIVMIVAELVMIALFQFVLTPLQVRATITQDFKGAFDFSFMKHFIRTTWKEQLVTLVFMFVVMLAMMVIALVTCYIGAFACAPVLTFAWHHLHKQFYQLYLSRGGEPVPVSPKLNDLPPALPQG